MHLKSYCQFLCLVLLLPLLSAVTVGQSADKQPLKLNASATIEGTVLLSQNNAGQQVGRLYLKDGKLVFDGDVDESARLFLQYVNRAYGETRAKGSACRFDDLLDALTVAESLYLPRTAEDPALIEDPYSGTTTPYTKWVQVPDVISTTPITGVTITPMQLDWDRATPEELRQLAQHREDIKMGIVAENAKIKAQTARRNAVAEHIRNLLAACGVKVASADGGKHTFLYDGADNSITLPRSNVVASGIVIAGDPGTTLKPEMGGMEGSVITLQSDRQLRKPTQSDHQLRKQR